MAHYRALVGPSYDQQAMLDARAELQNFLSLPIDNPQFRTTAAESLVIVTEWLGRKHIEIADFYARVGNDLGHRRHLQLAAKEYAETEAGKQATARLATLPPAGDGQ